MVTDTFKKLFDPIIINNETLYFKDIYKETSILYLLLYDTDSYLFLLKEEQQLTIKLFYKPASNTRIIQTHTLLQILNTDW